MNNASIIHSARNRNILRRRARPAKGCSLVSNSFGLAGDYHYEVFDSDGKSLCTLDATGIQEALRLARGAGLPAHAALKVPCQQ